MRLFCKCGGYLESQKEEYCRACNKEYVEYLMTLPKKTRKKLKEIKKELRGKNENN